MRQFSVGAAAPTISLREKCDPLLTRLLLPSPSFPPLRSSILTISSVGERPGSSRPLRSVHSAGAPPPRRGTSLRPLFSQLRSQEETKKKRTRLYFLAFLRPFFFVCSLAPLHEAAFTSSSRAVLAAASFRCVATLLFTLLLFFFLLSNCPRRAEPFLSQRLWNASYAAGCVALFYEVRERESERGREKWLLNRSLLYVASRPDRAEEPTARRQIGL